MDTARQVVRWSIPGWVFLLMLAVLQAITWLIQGSTAAMILAAGAPLLTPAGVAAVITAGVPLGFILYQIYYSWYGKVLPFGFVNRDRGAEILLAVTPSVRDSLCAIEGKAPDLEEMSDRIGPFLFPYPFRRLKPAFRNGDGEKRFERKVHDNWDLVRFWLHRVCFINEADHLRSEVTTLSDIYHAVGAARASLFLSCVLHFTFNLTVAQTIPLPIWRSVVAVVAPYMLALWLFRVFERTRTSALNSLLSMLTLVFQTFPTRLTATAGVPPLNVGEAHVATRSIGNA